MNPKKERSRKLGIVIVVAISLFFAVLFLLPIVLTITNSFMTESEIASNYGDVFAVSDKGGRVFISKQVNLKLIPDKVTFSQYYDVLLRSPEYLYKFWNSVILTFPIVFFQVIFACLASFGFARTTGKVKSILFFVYVLLTLMPYQVTLVPNYIVSEWLHLLNTKWAIWLPGFFSPFAVYILTKSMKRIPKSYFEAAKVDGASELKIFTKICMPLSRGPLISVVILLFIDYWNMVEQPLILLTDKEKYPLSIFLSQINNGEIGLAFAVAVIYMVPSLLTFLYGEDYLVDGIVYQGGVKG